MLREKDLKLEGAMDIGHAVEVMDNKLKSMSLSSRVRGESINVAYEQRPGWRLQVLWHTALTGARPVPRVWKVMLPVWHH